MTSQRIKNWPTDERPRERLLANGPEKLTDADLLAIICDIYSRIEMKMLARLSLE